MAGTTGLEPATSAVTGQRSNQLSYVPKLVWQPAGFNSLMLTEQAEDVHPSAPQIPQGYCPGTSPVLYT